MDPVSAAIVTGLAAGVAGGATDVGQKLIIDAYDALKAALKQKFGADSDVVEAVEYLEKKPEVPARQAGVEEEVKAAKADADPDVVAAAQTVLDALKKTPEGQQALSKYQIDAKNAQIGVIGDNAKIEG
ncbi:MAG TPA: hypothetical protein VEC93_05850, partial [Anaerolineae bacterium]|nr:hypothetical protein [Anaerolineae bacterium]